MSRRELNIVWLKIVVFIFVRPVPAITANRDPMNRLLLSPGRENNLSLTVSAKKRR